MRTLIFILEKEYKQIFRNPAVIRMLFIAPIMQLIILPWAANYEVKNIHVAITDLDLSTYTRKIAEQIRASDYFILEDYNHSYKQSLKLVEEDRVDVIMQFPAGFEKNYVRENNGKVFLAMNAINGAKANIGGAYLMAMLQSINRDFALAVDSRLAKASPVLNITATNRFNPHMNYKLFMVPGILVMLLTMIGNNLASGNIVREKELGTIEQINVTPIKKYQFILGKLLPFWTLALVALTFGLFIAFLFYGVVPKGSYMTIYLFAMVYMLAILGLGLLLATLSGNQQQAMLTSFFIMMVFVLMSGLYTSVDSMPEWAKVIARLNPITYFIEVMRMVVLKGSTLFDIRFHIVKVGIFAVLINALAIWNYRKRV